MLRERPADTFLVVALAIGIGGVDHHAQVHRLGDRRSALCIILLAIKAFKDHGAITERGDRWPVYSQVAFSMACLP